MTLRTAWIPAFLAMALSPAAQEPPQEARELRKADQSKTCGEYLGHFRRISWYYDFATATELARESGRPMFVIFCRSGTLLDPLTRKTKAAS